MLMVYGVRNICAKRCCVPECVGVVMSDRDDTGDRDPQRRRDELSNDNRAPNRRGDEGNGGGIVRPTA